VQAGTGGASGVFEPKAKQEALTVDHLAKRQAINIKKSFC
jgi:hypothetical protein